MIVPSHRENFHVVFSQYSLKAANDTQSEKHLTFSIIPVNNLSYLDKYQLKQKWPSVVIFQNTSHRHVTMHSIIF